MILYIDTTQNNSIRIGIKERNKFIASKIFSSRRTQAEKLLPAIDKFLKVNKLKLKDLRKIEVANRGGSFTSLRIGVITANALGYGLGITVTGEPGGAKKARRSKKRFSVVKPLYSGELAIVKK